MQVTEDQHISLEDIKLNCFCLLWKMHLLKVN